MVKRKRTNEQSPLLYFDIDMEVVAAMDKTMLKNTGSSDLVQFLVDKNQGANENMAITVAPFVEPNHPEWFTEFEVQPLNIQLSNNRFDDKEGWNRLLKSVIDDAKPEAKEPIEMYCETNDSTHVRISYYFRRVGPDGELLAFPNTLPFGFPVMRRLAAILLAFEKEIDKLLADNVGYVTHHPSALSNANNRIIRTFPLKQKLDYLWESSTTPENILELMCPGIIPTPTSSPTAPQPQPEPEPKPKPQPKRKYKRKSKPNPNPKPQPPPSLPPHPLPPLHYKYHLDPLLDPKNPHLSFRQHHGTLTPRTLTHWILFTANLIFLAQRATDADIQRLVHYTDANGVHLIELFQAMVAWQTLDAGLEDMMRFYCRRWVARGGSLRGRGMPSGGVGRLGVGGWGGGERWEVGEEVWL